MKLPECDRCNLYSRTNYLVCAVHPAGPSGKTCPDFESAELWEPENPEHYREQHMDEWFWHPIFTGKCPDCNHSFSRLRLPPLHWRCSVCGWEDDESDD
ncbi:hypothetical protein TUMEXPCC7403_02235 [Tumidithrix helvetica PCC 7403]|uniref:Uncharacterized protein n=1 Tax=Tumidithrix elongata BACA0141 TaxID=2716417 RepID=A0AAW9QBF3_9CYAN|nr:hypothetical protein [Tumidithrix elongata RA019]